MACPRPQETLGAQGVRARRPSGCGCGCAQVCSMEDRGSGRWEVGGTMGLVDGEGWERKWRLQDYKLQLGRGAHGGPPVQRFHTSNDELF